MHQKRARSQGLCGVARAPLGQLPERAGDRPKKRLPGNTVFFLHPTSDVFFDPNRSQKKQWRNALNYTTNNGGNSMERPQTAWCVHRLLLLFLSRANTVPMTRRTCSCAPCWETNPNSRGWSPTRASTGLMTTSMSCKWVALWGTLCWYVFFSVFAAVERHKPKNDFFDFAYRKKSIG